jgi:hypothetical protein
VKVQKGDRVRLNSIARYRLSHMVASVNIAWEGTILEVDPDGIAHANQFDGDYGIRFLNGTHLEIMLSQIEAKAGDK